jgi:hypothetical protein
MEHVAFGNVGVENPELSDYRAALIGEQRIGYLMSVGKPFEDCL